MPENNLDPMNSEFDRRSPDFSSDPLQPDTNPMSRHLRMRGVGGGGGGPTPDRIPGPDNEQWAKWLVQNVDEFNALTSDPLKSAVRRLAKRTDALTGLNKLDQFYDEIEEMTLDGRATDEEAGIFLERISRRAEQLDQAQVNAAPGGMPDFRPVLDAFNEAVRGIQQTSEAQQRFARGESTLELPRNPSELRPFIRSILDQIESVARDTYTDRTISTLAANLEIANRNLERTHPDIAKEVRTRLSLHDASELVRQANGRIEAKVGMSIGQAFEEADRRGRSITKEVVEMMLRNEMPGLRTKEAWDLVQDANFFYRHMVAEVNYNTLYEETRSRLSPAELDRAFGILEGVLFDVGKLGKRGEAIPNFASEDKYKHDVQLGLRLNRADRDWLLNKIDGDVLKKIFKVNDFELLDADKELGKAPTTFGIDSNRDRKRKVRELLATKVMVVENYYRLENIAVRKNINETDTNRIEQILKMADYNLNKLSDNNFVNARDRAWLMGKLTREELQQMAAIDEENSARRDAEKAIQLAEKLAIATLETSVWNRTAMTGNDQLAEIIGLKGWRANRRAAGRARGPQIHEGYIDGFGTSWLRSERRGGYGADIPNQPIYSDQIDIDGIKEGTWTFYGTVQLFRWYQLKNLLLDVQPRPEDRGLNTINLNSLQDSVVYFNTADPPPKPHEINPDTKEPYGYDPSTGEPYKVGKRSLRVMWILGMVDMALSEPKLGWDGATMGELYVALTREQLSDSAGSFITEEQWKWIEQQTDLDRRLNLDLGFRHAFQGFVANAMKPGGGGGGKRK